MTRDICLHLVLPKSLEELIIDKLLQHPAWVGPFVTYPVSGHAASEHITSEAERVRGRADRVKIDILMARDDARQLLVQLQADLPGADLSWWFSPVLDSGALT